MGERVGQYPFTEWYDASDVVLQSKVVGDAHPRYKLTADGTVATGDGTQAPTEQSSGASDALTDPSTISGCALWFDASTLTLSDSDPVSTWPDGSGNSNDATQATADNQPVFVAAGRNGHGVVRFDPAVNPQFLSLTSLALLKGKSGVSVFIAAKVTSGYLLWISNNTAATELRVSFDNDGATAATLSSDPNEDDAQANVLAPHAAQPSSWADLTSFAVQGGAHAWPATGGSVGSSFWLPVVGPLNANTAALDLNSSAVGPSPNTNALRAVIGSDGNDTAPFTGDIGEIVVYDRSLSASEQRRVLEYLSTKWAV